MFTQLELFNLNTSFENIDETGDMKIEYSKDALVQLSEAKEMGGTTQTSGSTLGSWVLVDAKTGKQMVNPNNGPQVQLFVI